MKLTYWYARCTDDSDSYSIIAKTKKGALAMLAERSHSDFDPVEKRTIEYTDAFDLFEQVTCEGGGRGWGQSK